MVSFYLFVFIGTIYSAWVLLEMRREVSGLRTRAAEDKPRLERIGSLYLSDGVAGDRPGLWAGGLTHKFSIKPGTPYYDAFEDRKQPLELAAVLGGVAVAYLS